VNYSEHAITFACAQDTLVGILAVPKAAADSAVTGDAPAVAAAATGAAAPSTTASSTGVIVIVGGPQYRAGSHRQFVLLSRALAAAGYPVLRFDYRGMGDSTGEQRDFLQVTPDIAAAIDALQRQLPSVTQVALWGLCDAASAALLYCHDTNDRRVSGLCLLNPWVRSEASLARTQVKHYYLQRLMQKEFWTKMLRGEVAFKALAGLMRNIRLAATDAGGSGAVASAPGRAAGDARPFQQRMATAWNSFSGRILLLLSGEDYTAKEFLEYASKDAAWKRALAHPGLVRHDLQGADHTFSSDADASQVTKLTLDWLVFPATHHQG
jgi:exosortase A-associated hydrolase 1